MLTLKDKLVSKVHKEFPELKFKKVKLITKGWDHWVLVLDNLWIFRFAHNKHVDPKGFYREVRFLQDFCKISSLPVPNYQFLSKNKTFGGYKIIKGKELTPTIYKKLTYHKKQKIIKDLAKFLTTLHNIPLKKAKSYGFKSFRSWGKMLKKKRKWFESEFYPKMQKHLNARQNNFIKKFIKYFCQSQYQIKPVLGHYDLSHDHIIMKSDGSISGIIDFGDIGISDPAHDFNGFEDYDSNLPKEIYKYYQGLKDSKFLKRCEDHFIHRWIYLLYDGKIRRKDKALWKEAKRQINKIIRNYGKQN